VKRRYDRMAARRRDFARVAIFQGAVWSDDYETYLVWIARHIKAQDPVYSLMQDAYRMGREISEDTAKRIMEEAGPPRYWDDTACAHGIRLTYALRQALKITSMGAIDKTRSQMTRLRKMRDRDQKTLRRREAGAKPRGKSLTKLRPWLDQGISRRAWFRNEAKAREALPQTRHSGTVGTVSVTPPFFLPHTVIVPIKTRVYPGQVLRGEVGPSDWLVALGILHTPPKKLPACTRLASPSRWVSPEGRNPWWQETVSTARGRLRLVSLRALE
jgi:hypothetical protein